MQRIFITIDTDDHIDAQSVFLGALDGITLGKGITRRANRGYAIALHDATYYAEPIEDEDDDED